jgi:hypothetical protein
MAGGGVMVTQGKGPLGITRGSGLGRYAIPLSATFLVSVTPGTGTFKVPAGWASFVS